MSLMRSPLLLLASIALFGIVPGTTAAPDPDGAEFIVGTDVFLADFAVSSTCSGPATVTLTIHRPGGDDVRQVDVDSLILPDTCFAPQCLDCPPVPAPMAWSMKGPGVDLVGTGVVYYDHYGYWELAWSLAGTFQEGTLEAHDTYG
jgi:hypothetical protein